jgi:hypothetical protein
LNDATFVDTPGFTISLLSLELATTEVVALSEIVALADLSSEDVVSFQFNLPPTLTSNLNELLVVVVLL